MFVLLRGPAVTATRGRLGLLRGDRSPVLAVTPGGLPVLDGLRLVRDDVAHQKEFTP